MLHVVLLVTAACVTGVRLDFTGACLEDSQCLVGHFCSIDEHYCQKCIRCEDLNRQPPKNNIKCVKSVSECGLCLKGLVADKDISLACKQPEASEGLPSVYVVVLVLVGLLLFLLVLGAVVYVLRHKDTFKISASTRTSVQAPAGGVAPSAPQSPPPYNFAAAYEPVRPASPAAPAPFTRPPYAEEETSAPLVKRAEGDSGARGVEAAGRQAAVPFNNPAYVRNIPPPSYESALSEESEQEGPFIPHDEDTMESPWTPAAAAAHDHNGNPPSVLTMSQELPAAARRPDRTEVVSPPPNKMRCLEDRNNNEQGESSGGPAPPPGNPPPPAAASVVINVLNVNSVRQLHDISL